MNQQRHSGDLQAPTHLQALDCIVVEQAALSPDLQQGSGEQAQ